MNENELVEKYLEELISSSDLDDENAYYNLIDFRGDSKVTEYLMIRFNQSEDRSLKNEIINLLVYFQDSLTLDFFGKLLYSEYWKYSLDALVGMGNKQALEKLEELNLTLSPAKEKWVAEAIEQIKEANK